MLRVEADGPVLHVTLDRPEVRNAFNDELIDALFNTFSTVPKDIRVVVLSGNGASFCAGGDLQWMKKAAAYTEEQNYVDALRLAGLFKSMSECPAIVIAKVHGAAYGGGCGLVAAADIALAIHGTAFAFSEVRLGLVPATISQYVMAKIGQGHARALFTTGEAFDADHALRIGLVHEVHVLADIDSSLNRKIDAVLTCGPEAAASCKAIAQAPPMSADEAARLLAKARAGKEGREGIAAFLEKRPPSFKVIR